MRQPLMLLAVSAALVLGGCSSLNPFVGTSKVKKAELQAFKPSSEVKVQWTQSVGKGGGESFVPVVRGKDVFAATADGTLLRLEDGKLKWRVQAGQSLSSGVGSDGKLVVVGTASGDILSFSAETGQPLWQAKVSSEVLAPPVVGESMVVVRSGDNRVYGFDLNDGKRKWVYQRNTPALALRNYASPVLAERFAFVGFPGGKLVALSLISGAPMWEGTVALPKGATELDRVADIVSSPVVDGRQVCAVAYQGRVACFDLGGSGNLLWARDMSSASGLAMDGRNVYVTDEKGAVHALDRYSGSSIWKQDKLYMRDVTGPAIRRGLVVVADGEGMVHFLSREDGAFSSRLATGGSPIQMAPRELESNFLVQNQKGELIAIEVQ